MLKRRTGAAGLACRCDVVSTVLCSASSSEPSHVSHEDSYIAHWNYSTLAV